MPGSPDRSQLIGRVRQLLERHAHRVTGRAPGEVAQVGVLELRALEFTEVRGGVVKCGGKLSRLTAGNWAFAEQQRSPGSSLSELPGGFEVADELKALRVPVRRRRQRFFALALDGDDDAIGGDYAVDPRTALETPPRASARGEIVDQPQRLFQRALATGRFVVEQCAPLARRLVAVRLTGRPRQPVGVPDAPPQERLVRQHLVLEARAPGFALGVRTEQNRQHLSWSVDRLTESAATARRGRQQGPQPLIVAGEYSLEERLHARQRAVVQAHRAVTLPARAAHGPCRGTVVEMTHRGRATGLRTLIVAVKAWWSRLRTLGRTEVPREVIVLRGPPAWANWQAERLGSPRRTTSAPDSVRIQPTWVEYALYTDAPLNGDEFTVGPYEFLAVDPGASAILGEARKALVLRAWDHLSDETSALAARVEHDVEDYFGGDIGDELAALLGLALDRRMRSGGPVRQGSPKRPLGLIWEALHRTPSLEPPRREPMIASLGFPVTLESAAPMLSTYPSLERADAVALVRAARQYADALWLADADARLAWIKLVGALEAAAARRDDARDETPVEQLKRHRRKLHRVLEEAPNHVMQAVAEDISRLFFAERKTKSFLRAFDPGPPAARPPHEWQRFDWDRLEDAVGVIYNHRSRDLHDGLPFPWALCQPPDTFSGATPEERYTNQGIMALGGQWTPEELPLYLHVFAHVVGGALRRWWQELAGAAGEPAGG